MPRMTRARTAIITINATAVRHVDDRMERYKRERLVLDGSDITFLYAISDFVFRALQRGFVQVFSGKRKELYP